MERTLIPEVIEKRAKAALRDLNDNLKTLDSHLGDIRRRVRRVTQADWRVSPERVNAMKDKILRETNEIATKARDWAGESYSQGLDRLGVATKDEVESLRKKLVTVQRRMRELKQTVTGASN